MIGGLQGTLVAAGLVGITAFGAGWIMRGDMQNSKLATNLAKFQQQDRELAIRREVNLWALVGSANRSSREIVDKFRLINELSAEARAKLLAAMEKERAAAAAAEAEAQHKIKELSDAASQMALDWKRGAIPADIVCGVFNGKGCPPPSGAWGDTNPDDGVEVRDGRPAAAPDAPS